MTNAYEQEGQFHLFWGGPFSQWLDSEFEIDGVTYNCCEQYMMAEKARLFKDDEALEAIMDSCDPREQKAIGRTVSNFDKDEWEKILPWGDDDEKPYCWQIVWKCNYAKFTQNPGLLEALMETGDKLLVEASPYDAIWGIKLGEEDPRAQDRSQWQGLNWLGEVITDVREAIRDGRNYLGVA